MNERKMLIIFKRQNIIALQTKSLTPERLVSFSLVEHRSSERAWPITSGKLVDRAAAPLSTAEHSKAKHMGLKGIPKKYSVSNNAHSSLYSLSHSIRIKIPQDLAYLSAMKL